MSVNVLGGALEFDSVINDSLFQAQINRMEKRINSFTDNVERQGNQIESFAKKAATAATGFLSVQAASNFVQEMIRVRGQFQQIEVAFRTMLKSKSAADELMRQAVQLAAQTPFTLQDVASGAKQLLAYGFSAKEVTGNLEMLGNIASGVGSQLTDVVYLYGTLKASGRVTQTDINQFAGRGIPIYEALAKVIGKNTTEVRAYVEAGRIGFPQIEQAFKNMTGPAGQFFNLMQEQSKTLTGQLSNLEDAWSRMLNALGQQNEGLFSSAIGGAIDLVNNYQEVLDILGLLVITYGAYRAALVLTAVNERIVAEGQLQMALSGNALSASQIRVAGATSLMNQGLVSLRTTLLALNTITAASTAVFAALSVVTYALLQSQSAAAAIQERNSELHEQGALSAKKEKESIEQLVTVLKSQTATAEQKDAAYKKLQASTGSVLNGYSAEEIAAGKAKDAIVEYIRVVEKATEARIAFDEFNKINNKIAEIDVKGIKAISTMDKLAQSIKNTFLPTSQGLGMKEWAKGLFSGDNADSKVVEQTRASLIKQREDLRKKYSNDFEKQITGVDSSEKPTTLVRSEAYIKEQIKQLEEARSGLDIHSKAYETYTNKIKALNDELMASQGKMSSEQKKVASERIAALEAISNAENEAHARGLSNNQQEIALNKIKYDLLRKQAKEAGLGTGSAVRIDRIEHLTTGDIRYKQETEVLKTSLDEQKKLYEDYENYKKDFGEKLARQRYAGELDISKTYLDLLKQEYSKSLISDFLGIGNGDRSVELQKRIKAQNDVVKKASDETLLAALQSSETYQSKREEIDRRYNDLYLSLEKSRTALTSEEYTSRVALLAKSKEQELSLINDAAYQESESFRRINSDILTLSKQQIQVRINTIESILKSENKLSEKQKETLKKNLEDAKKAMSDSTFSLNGSLNDSALRARKVQLEESLSINVLTTEELAKQTRELEAINAQLQKNSEVSSKFAKLSGDLGTLSGSFASLSSSLEGVNDELAYTLSSVSGLLQIGSDAAGAFSSFASGDIIGGISKSISAIAGLFSIGKKIKEMNAKAGAEVQAFYDNAITGEREYQAALRDRARQQIKLNELTVQGLKDAARLLGGQSGSIQSEYEKFFGQIQQQQFIESESFKKGGLFKKAKVVQNLGVLSGKTYDEIEQLYTQGKLTDGAKRLFEQLQRLKQEGKDVADAMADLGEQARQIFTGTTADSLTDTLLEMFKKGETGAKDLSDFFEQSMTEAAFSIFKNNVLSGLMADFYKEFAAKAQSDDKLTSNEIEELRSLFTSLTGQATAMFDDLKKVTGLDFNKGTSSSSNSLTGSIKRELSEETGSLIAGQFNGLRLTAIEQLNVAKSNLDNVIKIEKNTRDTATTLVVVSDTLKAMDRKMASTSNQLKGAGI